MQSDQSLHSTLQPPNPTDLTQTQTPNIHISAPRNCFMIYRCDIQSKISKLYPALSSRDLSRIIAENWKSEPESVKEKYRNQATQEKELHKIKHPLYKRIIKKRKQKIDPVPSPDQSIGRYNSTTAHDKEYNARIGLFFDTFVHDPTFTHSFTDDKNSCSVPNSIAPIYFDSMPKRRKSTASMPLLGFNEECSNSKFNTIKDALGPM